MKPRLKQTQKSGWLFRSDNQVQDPVGTKTILKRMKDGSLTPSSLVAHSDTPDTWQPISEYPDFLNKVVAEKRAEMTAAKEEQKRNIEEDLITQAKIVDELQHRIDSAAEELEQTARVAKKGIWLMRTANAFKLIAASSLVSGVYFYFDDTTRFLIGVPVVMGIIIAGNWLFAKAASLQ